MTTNVPTGTALVVAYDEAKEVASHEDHLPNLQGQQRHITFYGWTLDKLSTTPFSFKIACRQRLSAPLSTFLGR